MKHLQLWRNTSALVSLAVAITACTTSAPQMHGEIAGLRKLANEAETHGAIHCAPNELATARTNLEFATNELEQGSILRAQDHLAIARMNARAAYDLSPADKCTAHAAPIGDCDGDGYKDNVDSCKCEPETFNGFEDEDGCPDDPDTDKDGIADARDTCVLIPEDKDNYLDSDGCPEPDNDLDTVLDVNDKDASGKTCALDPEDPDGYEDADGCPDLDNDKDTVADIQDQCPNEPGEPGGAKPGCPQKPALVIVTNQEIKITQQIHFEFDKDKIRSESFPILDAVVAVLKQNPKIKLEIQGHTDNKGAAEYNRKLSDRRAASVKKYLVSKGIDATRLTSKGYGMDKPLVANTSDQNRTLNRRVQFMRTENSP